MLDELEAKCSERVGEILNMKWRLDSLIGVGGMASVFASTHRNGAKSAIKILHPELAVDRDIRTRFLREAYIANKVDHPGSVRVLDDDLDEFNTPYIVMELLEGETLEVMATRSEGTLPIGEVLYLMIQLLDVLEAAHDAGIVHRDIKPENIFITAEGVLKVLDFGIARLKDPSFPSRTKTGIVFGTPAFMTPEQALGRHKQVDERTDLFAVGAIIFNVLSGQPVHEGTTANEIVISAATRPARSLARVIPLAPLSLVRVVDKALQFEQSKRFRNASEMREAINSLRVEEPEPSPPYEPRPSRGQRSSYPEPRSSYEPKPSNEPRSSYSPEEEGGAQRELLSALIGNRAQEASLEEIEQLREFFKVLDRTLTSKKQYDLDHPEVQRRMEMLEEHLTKALDMCPQGLLWSVKPYAFSAGEVTLWEPESPFDRIPYQLFADGVRTILLLQGLETAEFHRFLGILTLDRALDMPPEDDFVTLLWEADFNHIDFEAIDSFSEGDQDQRGSYERSRNKVISAAKLDTSYMVEDSWRKVKRSGKGANDISHARHRLIGRLAVHSGPEREAALRALSFGEAFSSEDHRALENLTGIDESTYVMLGARLDVSPDDLAGRFATAATEAYIAFSQRSVEKAIEQALRRAVDGLASAKPMAAVEMVRTLCEALVVREAPETTEQLRTQLAGAIVSAELMTAIWKQVSSMTTGEAEREAHADGLAMVLQYIDERHLPIIMKAFGEIEPGAVFDVLHRYIDRVASGQERILGEALPSVALDQAMKLIHILATLSTPEAQTAISEATKNRDPVVRIEALGHLEGVSGERLRLELRALVSDKDPIVRLAALKAMEEHKVMAAGPFLALRVRSPAFQKLPLAERQQAFATLSTLAPGRTEAICLDVLDDSRLVSRSNHEETRALAAETLGRLDSSKQAVKVLKDLSKRRWKNTERVRGAARQALAQLEARGINPQAVEPGDGP